METTRFRDIQETVSGSGGKSREGIVNTEAQLQALEVAKKEKESHPDEIETEHLGYLISQDTF